jgi:hypothetical protein
MASVRIIAERGPRFMRSCHFGLNKSMERLSAAAMNCGAAIPCTLKSYCVRLHESKTKKAQATQYYFTARSAYAS